MIGFAGIVQRFKYCGHLAFTCLHLCSLLVLTYIPMLSRQDMVHVRVQRAHSNVYFGNPSTIAVSCKPYALVIFL